MSPRTVVVDGSNLATEGRSMPSLVQLDEAVRAYRDENPDDEIIVVVDATFAHRIPDEERPTFEEAASHNELVYPPAGAIGRGDAFLLRIADKTGAVVLSNDSFQEFHGEFDWLFEKGRLVGGTPVPGVGWIFVPRTPVRGPKSREAVKEAKRTRARVGSKEASQPMPIPKAPPPRAKKKAEKKKDEKVEKETVAEAIAEATEEAVSPADDGNGAGKRKRRRRRRGPAPAELPTLNEPLTFIEFIAEHKLGSTVEGVVDSFSSHGAFVLVGDARCYIPLSAMGEPPPRSAREVLHKGDVQPFVVQALDAPRRGIELALPGHERVAGAPTPETVEAEVTEAGPVKVAKKAKKPAAAGKTAPPKKKAPAQKKEAASKKEPAPKKAAAKKESRAATKQTAKKTATKEPAQKRAAAEKTAAKKHAAKTPAAPKKAAVTKTPLTKATATKKQPAAAKTAPAAKKEPVKKAAATKAAKTQPATRKKETAPKKAAGKKAAAKKAAPKKAATKTAAKKK